MVIEDGKFVELTYKVIDKKTKDVLSEVEFPLGYIQGISEVLSSEVTAELVGQEQGDVIELPSTVTCSPRRIIPKYSGSFSKPLVNLLRANCLPISISLAPRWLN
jgi:hypothetical protein